MITTRTTKIGQNANEMVIIPITGTRKCRVGELVVTVIITK